MNVVKLQAELLKDVFNKKGGKWFISENNMEETVTLMASHQMWFIPKNNFIFDIKTLNDLDVRNTNIVNGMLEKYKDTKPLEKTFNKRVYYDKTLIELKSGDDLIYVDEKLLKLYDKSVTFAGTKPKEPVYLLEDDILVGLVLPVSIKM
mgnify:CR=1 FL=1